MYFNEYVAYFSVWYYVCYNYWRENMKKIEAIVKPFKLAEIWDALTHLGIEGITVSEIKCCGKHARLADRNGSALEFSNRIKLEIVVTDALCEAVAEAVVEAGGTGRLGDGHVNVFEMEKSICIRANHTNGVAA